MEKKNEAAQPSHRQRMMPQERRRLIIKAATKVFLKKGYKEASMKDIVRTSGLSQGGFYHYYKNKADILLDILEEGNKLRFCNMLDFMDSNPGMSKEELLVEMSIAKLFDKNEIKRIYAMYLIEISSDKQLKKRSEERMKEFMEEYLAFIDSHGLGELKRFTKPIYINLLNCILLGVEVLDARDSFLAHRNLFKRLLLAALKTETSA